MFHKIPYANLDSPYGEGNWLHFFDKMTYVCGIPLVILFWIGLAGFSFNADIEEIKDSFDRVNLAFKAKNKSPRLVTSFWFGLGDNGREIVEKHLTRYLGWMGDDIAESLAKTAGIAGNEKSLKDLLVKNGFK